MTVIAQDDHLTAGAWAACDSSRSFLKRLEIFPSVYPCLKTDKQLDQRYMGNIAHDCGEKTLAHVGPDWGWVVINNHKK